MSMTQRQSQILHTLASERRAEVGRLAELVGVSQVTIRKDLAFLEEKGLIKRQHGVAVLDAETDINNRLAVHYERKLDIASRAVELISDGDVVMIESGSCCALLAEQIVQKAPRRNDYHLFRVHRGLHPTRAVQPGHSAGRNGADGANGHGRADYGAGDFQFLRG
jgi:DNA-binding Lrp family transcriptional regulator